MFDHDALVPNDSTPVPRGTGDSFAQSLTVTTHLVDNITVVTATGEIDMATAPGLVTALRAASDSAAHGLIVDLTSATFLASAGMSALFFTRGLVHSRGIGFAVVAVGPTTARPLELMELTDVLGVKSSLDDALTALAR